MGFFSNMTRGVNEFKALPVQKWGRKILEDHKNYSSLGFSLGAKVLTGSAAGATIAGEDNRIKGAALGGLAGLGLHSMDYLGRTGAAARWAEEVGDNVYRAQNKAFIRATESAMADLKRDLPNANHTLHKVEMDTAIMNEVRADNIGGHLPSEMRKRAMSSPFGLHRSFKDRGTAVYKEMDNYFNSNFPSSAGRYEAVGKQAFYDAVIKERQHKERFGII